MFDRIADAVITTVAPVVAMDGCSVRMLDRVEAAVAAGSAGDGQDDAGGTSGPDHL